MQLGTINLSKENNRIDSQNAEFLSKYLTRTKVFKIELLEISNVISPTSLILKIICDSGRFNMPFYKHIKDFINYNDTFILDTSAIDKLELNSREGFFIEILSDEDFKIKMFYSTDRPSALDDEEYI